MLTRPKQWFKSLYVAVGAIPAIFLLPIQLNLIFTLLLVGILNMILMQGVIYTINDIWDAPQDRLHPKKKNRPIASGKIGGLEGYIFALFLLALALTTAYLIDFRLVKIDVAMLVINILYSMKPFRFKDVKLLDILTAASNFPLRVMVGWYLFEPFNQAHLLLNFKLLSTQIAGSSIQKVIFNSAPRILEFSANFSTITLSFISIMLFTFSLAVFLLTNKRLNEKIKIKNAQETRKSLKYYSLTSLRLLSLSSMTTSVFFYAVFAWALKPLMIALTPLVLIITYWYYKMALKTSSMVDAPEDMLMKNKSLLIFIIVFLISSIVILFF